MAEVVDEVIEVDNGDDIQAVDEIKQPQPEIAPETVSRSELPEKYRGKSVEDLVKMHQHAEGLASRHAQEVGEIRQLADQLIQTQMQPKPEKKPEVDFFANPEEAVRQAVENNPVVIAARNQTQQLQQVESKRTLMTLHPDVGRIMSDPNFAEWVMGSKVRTRLFQQAEAYDVDAANELLSTYKELRGARQPMQQIQDDPANVASRSNALQAASVETGGTNETTRKVYRRADLIRLKMTNPAKYEAMQDEISRAYAEDRVR